MKIFYYKHTKAVLGSFLLLILSNGCNNRTSTAEISIPVTNVVKTEVEVSPKNFTYQQIAEFAIATIMNQPKDIVLAAKSNEIYTVSYTRKSDSEKFNYKVKFEGNKIIWSNIDGRWRNGEYDEKITFREEGNKLTIVQTFSDGSESVKEFLNK